MEGSTRTERGATTEPYVVTIPVALDLLLPALTGQSTAEPLAYPIKEAAAKIGLSVDMLRRIIDRGEIGVVRVGTKPLIPRAELERWLVEGTTRIGERPWQRARVSRTRQGTDDGDRH